MITGQNRDLRGKLYRWQHNTGLLLKAAFPRVSFRKTVLVMIWSFYGGGAEKVASILAGKLADRYRVVLLCFQDKGKCWPLPRDAEYLVLPSFFGTEEEMERWVLRYIRLLKWSRGVFASISFMYRMNRLNVLSGGPGRVITAERNDPLLREPEHFEEIEALYEAADHVVFQSEAVRAEFGPAVRAHSSILPNPVRISSLREEPVRHEIVNIGRLHAQKNQSMLIRAFAAFRKTHPDYALSFYGKGEAEAELRELADSLGVGESVHFYPPAEDVHERIRHAEIFALSSDYEGMSNALLECMMMGFPCISTRSGGAPEVIEDGVNGLLVPVGSEEEMTAALCRLAEDNAYRERIGARAAEDAKRFHEDEAFAEWQRMLEGVLQKP